MNSDKHLIITSPDRHYGEGMVILLIDWHWKQIEPCISALSSCNDKVVLHLFGAGETDFRWLIDVANQADLIIMNNGVNTQADLIKGSLIPKDKTLYFGRRDLSSIFSGYIEDPIGTLLSWVTSMANRRGLNEPR